MMIVAGGALALSLAACATPPAGGVVQAVQSQTPAQRLYNARIALDFVESAAFLYASMPTCGPAAPAPFCSQPVIVADIDTAERLADAALANATRLVNDASASPAAQQAAIDDVAAQAARLGQVTPAAR